MRARPVCIQESENFWRKVARGQGRTGSEEKAKFLSTARERRRNRRDVISIDDDDEGSGDGDGDDGEIEERKG